MATLKISAYIYQKESTPQFFLNFLSNFSAFIGKIVLDLREIIVRVSQFSSEKKTTKIQEISRL